MPINYEIKKQTPDNINDLVEMAGDRNSWRKRLEAINEFKKWNCQKSRDVLTRLELYLFSYPLDHALNKHFQLD